MICFHCYDFNLFINYTDLLCIYLSKEQKIPSLFDKDYLGS